jgi:hypothetical protein
MALKKSDVVQLFERHNTKKQSPALPFVSLDDETPDPHDGSPSRVMHDDSFVRLLADAHHPYQDIIHILTAHNGPHRTV